MRKAKRGKEKEERGERKDEGKRRGKDEEKKYEEKIRKFQQAPTNTHQDDTVRVGTDNRVKANDVQRACRLEAAVDQRARHACNPSAVAGAVVLQLLRNEIALRRDGDRGVQQRDLAAALKYVKEGEKKTKEIRNRKKKIEKKKQSKQTKQSKANKQTKQSKAKQTSKQSKQTKQNKQKANKQNTPCTKLLKDHHQRTTVCCDSPKSCQLPARAMVAICVLQVLSANTSVV